MSPRFIILAVLKWRKIRATIRYDFAELDDRMERWLNDFQIGCNG